MTALKGIQSRKEAIGAFLTQELLGLHLSSLQTHQRPDQERHKNFRQGTAHIPSRSWPRNPRDGLKAEAVWNKAKWKLCLTTVNRCTQAEHLRKEREKENKKAFLGGKKILQANCGFAMKESGGVTQLMTLLLLHSQGSQPLGTRATIYPPKSTCCSLALNMITVSLRTSTTKGLQLAETLPILPKLFPLDAQCTPSLHYFLSLRFFTWPWKSQKWTGALCDSADLEE